MAVSNGSFAPANCLVDVPFFFPFLFFFFNYQFIQYLFSLKTAAMSGCNGDVDRWLELVKGCAYLPEAELKVCTSSWSTSFESCGCGLLHTHTCPGILLNIHVIFYITLCGQA